VIESFSPIGGPSATIKSHHNVGGLPPDLHFKLIEPVRELFKDEVRALGRELGLPDAMVSRQPFPGPGLAVRIVGEVTPERVELLQKADLRVQEEMAKLPNYKEIWQSFAVLLPVQSVGVMGDSRTYENVAGAARGPKRGRHDRRLVPRALRRAGAGFPTASSTKCEASTAWCSTFSSKPPATIEWE